MGSSHAAQMVWRQINPQDNGCSAKLNKNCAFQGEIEENIRKMGIFLRFLIKKSAKNLHVSNIYLKFAAHFMWKCDN